MLGYLLYIRKPGPLTEVDYFAGIALIIITIAGIWTGQIKIKNPFK